MAEEKDTKADPRLDVAKRAITAAIIRHLEILEDPEENENPGHIMIVLKGLGDLRATLDGCS